MESKFHEGLYSFSKYYDIAFDFKDVPKECAFLEGLFLKHSQRKLASFIEFGAGPALHCLELAKSLRQVTAVDLSQEMADYAKMKSLVLGVSLDCDCADMVTYQSSKTYDMAALLMDSTSYLLTNAQVIEHLHSVAKVLNPGGLYVLEMSHPKSVFDISKTTVNEWNMEREGIKVKVTWGGADDKFNPITQLTEVSVVLEYQDGDKTGILHDRSLQRCFTATEFAALVTASGVFEIVEYYGGMNLAMPFNNEEHSWRMVPVLRKI
ncbi:MAG: class I SAM-dependent methyltransferase [Bdellovibrionales bacterium]|nr:class I SAM-dependent methyltransferase [Bdellovibrionales bacterium]